MRKKEEIAIQLKGVKKRYQLGQIGGGTLQGDLQSWWARVRGKEDPNTKIEQRQRLVGKTFMAFMIFACGILNVYLIRKMYGNFEKK